MQAKLNWLLAAEKSLEKCLELEPDYELASQGLERLGKEWLCSILCWPMVTVLSVISSLTLLD